MSYILVSELSETDCATAVILSAKLDTIGASTLKSIYQRQLKV